MKIEVEISQNRRVGENQYVPALIGLIIGVETGNEGPNAHIQPNVSIFIDLTVEEARNLSQGLTLCAEIIEEGIPRSL